MMKLSGSLAQIGAFCPTSKSADAAANAPRSGIPPTANVSSRLAVVPAPIVAIIFLIAIVTPWISVADHPLYTPDEGRYGVIGLHMAEGGSWLVPVFEGHVHLTKPPLEYWAIATGIRILGRTELATRIPSLLASSGALGVLLFLACKMRGRRVAVLSVATLSAMPLFVFVGRIATTDAMLSFFWVGAMACGWHGIDTRRSRWVWLMWILVAGGLLAKGPLALAPVGVLIVWLSLAGRWRDIMLLKPLRGIAIAAVPIMTWVALIIMNHPDAIDIWRHEMVDRVTGGGSHPEPWWYYFPVFFFGLFPATVMLVLPGLNVSLRRTWQELRSGSDVALLILAVVIPFIGFSLMVGKLATYLLPICAPLALLNAIMLEQWISGVDKHLTSVRRLPDVRITMTIAALVVFIGMAIGMMMFARELLMYLVPPALFVATTGWLWFNWNRRPSYRAKGLIIVWSAWVLNFWGLFEIEDYFNDPRDPNRLMAQIQHASGATKPELLTYGFGDPTLSFYNDDEVSRLDFDPDGGAATLSAPHEKVILVNENFLDEFTSKFGEWMKNMQQLGTWQRQITNKAIIMRQPGRSDLHEVPVG